MNTIIEVGNATRDAELRFTPNGKAVATFSIAVTQGKSDDGGWNSDFFNVQAWGKLAENCAESIQKGTKVIVVGKLIVDKYTDKEGIKKQNYKINAINVGVDLSYARAVTIKNDKASPEQVAYGSEVAYGSVVTKDEYEQIDFDSDDIPF